MKVTAIETVRVADVPNLVWVIVNTDEGLSGLGESYFDPVVTETHVHEHIAPYLLGRPALRIEEHHHNLVGYLGQHGSGAAQRARGMVDIALWDILGKAANMPLCDLLGGPVRDSVPIYNTCAGRSYNIRPNAREASFDHGLTEEDAVYEDTTAFLTRPVALAESLLAMNITGMKIWPFDFLPEARHGEIPSVESMKKAVWPFAEIRKALGDRIDLMCELHGLWSVPAARQIAEALAPYDLKWIEDPVSARNIGALGRVREGRSPPIAIGETFSTEGMLQAMWDRSLDYLVTDLAWGGGITNARRVASFADSCGLSVLYHDCTGPVILAASLQLALATRATPMQEIARAYYYDWYRGVADGVPIISEGRLESRRTPGHGVTLRADILSAEGTTIRRTAV